MTLKDILKNYIKAAKNGDQTAYNYLLNTFWNDVHNFLLSKTNGDIDAEDITITTFSKAFDKLETYNDKYAFKSWLLTIAKNLLIDESRKHHNQTISLEQQEKKVLGILDNDPSPEDIIIQEQNLASLKKDIKQLKIKYQKVIHLRYFQDMSYQEIADELNEPINNIKVKLLRAKKLLTEIIKKKSYDY